MCGEPYIDGIYMCAECEIKELRRVVVKLAKEIARHYPNTSDEYYKRILKEEGINVPSSDS